ncbi:4204_t:CDS:10, partial [Diversispora eburnea]
MVVGKLSFLSSQQNREVTELGLRLKDASDNVVTNQFGLQVSSKRPIIKRVLEVMASGIDVSPLFGDVVKAERNADLVILAVNTFQKDLQDENPLVRGLALRTLCSMRISDYVSYMLESLIHALGDSSSYVRKTALTSAIKVFYLSPKHVLETSLIDQMYNILRDRDPEVVTNGIVALNEILSSQGGMTINKKIAHYLFQRFREFNEWHQCLVMNILCRYKPESEEEIFEIMNLLDDGLRHHNSGVQLATMKLFIQLTLDIPEVHEDLYKRIKEPLLTLLSLSIPEIMYSCLEHLYLLVLVYPSRKLLERDYKQFYRRINEPSYVTIKKLDLLQEIATEVNSKEIIDEISGYITSDNGQITNKSIQTIAKISLKIENVLTYSLEIFTKFLDARIENIISNIIMVLEGLLLIKRPKEFDDLSLMLPSIWMSIDLNSLAGPAFLNLLTTIGSSLPESPYILESLVRDIDHYSSISFHVQLLNSAVTLFLKRPAECQEMLARLFKTIMECTDQSEVCERAEFLFQLLKCDISVLRPLHEFNTLSVIWRKSLNKSIIDSVESIVQKKIPSYNILNFDKRLNSSSKNLVDILEVNDFIFSKTISMDANTFRSLNLDDIEYMFEKNNILTMASGDSNYVLKFFLYAQEEKSQTIFLCELKINIQLAYIDICIKS